MQTEKIIVAPVSLARLIQDMERGRLRIPRFQREFVWERTRIQKLLDSMFKEYPIGTLFFWEAPSDYNHLLRDLEELQQPPRKSGENYTFILDGQQRLTSLYAVIKGLLIRGDDYSRIVVDLGISDPNQNLPFLYRKPDNQRWITVRDLLGEEIFTIYNKLPNDEYKQRFERYRNVLTKYPFSVVTVSEMDIEDAIEIFERINQQGRRLSRYDLITASVLTDSFDLRERTEKDIADRISPSFGEIPETSIPQALALNIKGSTEYNTQMSLRTEDVQAVWPATVECLMLAVEFVRSQFGVARLEFLPYDAMLPVLQHYFYYGNTRSIISPSHLEQLERWFWRTTFSERYSSASQTRMTEDAGFIRKLIDSGHEFDFPVTLTLNALINGSMRSTTSAVRNGILCLLNLKRPLRFDNGSEFRIDGDDFSKFTRAERHHVFPASFLKERGHDSRDVHRIPNFCFIPADLNKRISDNPPSQYMLALYDMHGEHRFGQIIRTHLLPLEDDSGLWSDDYDTFITRRASLLYDEILHRCGVVPRISEEHRNPVVDTLEKAIRDLVHDTLSNTFGYDYWREGVMSVAGDVHSRIESRIDDFVRKTPGVSKSQFASNLRAKWDYADLSDYPKIILSKKCWPNFAPVFRSKLDTERYLDDFREFRNRTKHTRDIDSILEHRGQAAILWLTQTLEVDLSQYGVF